jgi:hypothetical protein
MGPSWALKPGLTDPLVIGRKVTLTLTLTTQQSKVFSLWPDHKLYNQANKLSSWSLVMESE